MGFRAEGLQRLTGCSWTRCKGKKEWSSALMSNDNNLRFMVANEDKDCCNFFMRPHWLQRALSKCGLAAITRGCQEGSPR